MNTRKIHLLDNGKRASSRAFSQQDFGREQVVMELDLVIVLTLCQRQDRFDDLEPVPGGIDLATLCIHQAKIEAMVRLMKRLSAGVGFHQRISQLRDGSDSRIEFALFVAKPCPYLFYFLQ